MDQIFIRYPGLIVCGKPDLTQRERPQLFIDAERERIAEAEGNKIGHSVMDEKSKATVHDERV